MCSFICTFNLMYAASPPIIQICLFVRSPPHNFAHFSNLHFKICTLFCVHFISQKHPVNWIILHINLVRCVSLQNKSYVVQQFCVYRDNQNQQNSLPPLALSGDRRICQFWFSSHSSIYNLNFFLLWLWIHLWIVVNSCQKHMGLYTRKI